MSKRKDIKRPLVIGPVLAAAAVGLLLAGLAAAGSSVEVLRVLPSSQNPRITVLHNGNPLPAAKIAVFAADEQLRLSLSADEHGVVVLPPLPPARYHIAAAAADGLGADLVLVVSKHQKKKASSFSMDLFVRPPAPPTLEERIVAAESGPARERLREFKGIAVDPAGMGIPETRIEVLQEGSRGKVRVAITESDKSGHFSAQLPAGTYTVVFQVQGFSTRIQVLEITQTGDETDLRVHIELAAST
jgi:Carboxypeptidase regulatory-like domain